MKKCICIFLAGLLFSISISAQTYNIQSPDSHLSVTIKNGKNLQFSIMKEGKIIVPAVEAAMILPDATIPSANDKIKRTAKQQIRTILNPVVAVKNSVIKDEYNTLDIQFKNHVTVQFRVYNDAVAYRFKTDMPDSITVMNERCNVSLPDNSSAWFAFADRWMNSYEHLYKKLPVDSVDKNKTAQLPLLLDLNQNGKLLITESDLYDYPGLYFTGNNSNSLESIFPPAVKTEKKNSPKDWGWDRTFHPETVYDYIAHTSGRRSFPWRIFATANDDKDLLNNDIVFKLGRDLEIKNTDWIKPGQVAWDWWNNWNVTGVDFHAGVNTETYKYYIDFASQNKIPYIIMDEGWYQLGNMLERVPSVDVKAIADYGKQKNVGVILWCVWRTLDEQMQQAMDQFEQWGVKGIKVDFMDRDDQAVVNFYWRCAKAAADHHLLVDYHGAHKPAGITRAYPNVINFEGVPGLEQDKWTNTMATPWMAVILPYIRMFAGPMDYTPGAMRNAQLKDFAPINDNPMSLGTRCQQLAMYVIYDAPLQMLADNPTAYNKEKESLDFITHVPTTWDETIPLDGKVGQFVALARKKGNEYFAAAMNNWDERDITIDFSFLPEGKYTMILFRDGVNADRNGIDYKREERTISSKDRIQIHLAKGGGWAARIFQE